METEVAGDQAVDAPFAAYLRKPTTPEERQETIEALGGGSTRERNDTRPGEN
jgi:hypothetical protein